MAIPAGIWNCSGEVYNPGSGRANSCSILEAFEMVERPTGKRMKYECVDAARAGDPIWYTGDLRRLRSYYPEWLITRSRDHILRKIVKGWGRATVSVIRGMSAVSHSARGAVDRAPSPGNGLEGSLACHERHHHSLRVAHPGGDSVKDDAREDRMKVAGA